MKNGSPPNPAFRSVLAERNEDSDIKGPPGEIPDVRFAHPDLGSTDVEGCAAKRFAEALAEHRLVWRVTWRESPPLKVSNFPRDAEPNYPNLKSHISIRVLIRRF